MCLPGLKELREEVHAADRVVHFHCDANMCKLTEEMVEAGVDIYQSIEPHEPMVEGSSHNIMLSTRDGPCWTSPSPKASTRCPDQKRAGEMEYREIGSTGIAVSVIGLGTWPMGGIDGGVIGESRKVKKQGWSGAVDEESIKTVRRAEELGVNFVHSSEAYGGGHAESVLGTALKGRRDRFIVATKVRPIMESGDVPAARERIHEALEGSLRRLQTDYVDIHQLHSFPHEDTTAAVMEEYGKLREQGKVRHVAISATDPERIRELKGFGDLVAIMFAQSVMAPRRDDAFDLAAELNLGSVILSPLHAGVLADLREHAGDFVCDRLAQIHNRLFGIPCAIGSNNDILEFKQRMVGSERGNIFNKVQPGAAYGATFESIHKM